MAVQTETGGGGCGKVTNTADAKTLISKT